MAVQVINVESFLFLRKFIGPKNPLESARIAYFVFCAESKRICGRAIYFEVSQFFSF